VSFQLLNVKLDETQEGQEKTLIAILFYPGTVQEQKEGCFVLSKVSSGIDAKSIFTYFPLKLSVRENNDKNM
jgi:hypothetical protein